MKNIFQLACIALILIGLGAIYTFNRPKVDLTEIKNRLEMLETGMTPTIVIEGQQIPIWQVVANEMASTTDAINKLK